MDFKKQRSIYQQIADQLCDRIAAGEWKPDERIVSVRDLATELQVNVNTVMRSFERLQWQEIIYTRRGMGYYVAPDGPSKVAALQRQQFLEEVVPALRQRMRQLGITVKDLEQYLNQ